MGKLENITLGELYDALDEVSGKKPTQRLMLAILYKQGPSVPMIADWYDMRAETIYSWFTQMDEDPLMEAIHDESPPGRPPKLSREQRREFEATLQESPQSVGYEAAEWSTELVRTFLREEFDVEYTLRHVRRLMNDAGVE